MTKLTDQPRIVQAITDARASITQAAATLGVHRVTLWRWLRMHPGVLDAIQHRLRRQEEPELSPRRRRRTPWYHR